MPKWDLKKTRLGNNGTFKSIMDLALLFCRFVNANIDIVKQKDNIPEIGL